ncbi:hypothetical protein PVK06_022122 [Gossypium arboreum]|uniref:Phosphoglycerate mutase-like protein n=2 Tax=Gossypium arboreum TaxID=29729 RepID=A0ABR0P7P7_GOSAR|nr:hypothetical protein PVK06_022122 [Gossypium arboreum]
MASTSRELSNNEKRLHLMRHAHELHNSKEETNPQLSPLGSQQVRDERKNLSASGVLQSIELIVTSPLTRTLQTSVGVFLGSEEHGDNCNNPIIIATELCRVRMIESEYDISWEAEERETDEAVAARAVEFIGWLLARKEKEIAVVSHGGFLKQTLLAIGHKCDPLVTCDNFTPQRMTESFHKFEERTRITVNQPTLGEEHASQSMGQKRFLSLGIHHRLGLRAV